jgi:serine protease
VTGHAIDGDLAHYANVDPQVALSAPGGGCGKLTFGRTCTDLSSSNGLGLYSTFNTGTTSPGADSYAIGVGTSGGAPMVAGVAALLFSVNPTLSPAQVRSILQSSARPFPAGSWCASSGVGLCGAGLLDAQAALQEASVAPTEPASGGGGCTLSQTGTVDILLPVLFLFGLALQAWRLKKSTTS